MGLRLPFYFVQISPWSGARYVEGELPACGKRRRQAEDFRKPAWWWRFRSWLITSQPVSANTKDVGNRLALWELVRIPTRRGPSIGPLCRDMKVEGDKVRLTFAHCGRRPESRGRQDASWFEIAWQRRYVRPRRGLSMEHGCCSAKGVASPEQGPLRMANKTPTPTLHNKEAARPRSRPRHWREGAGEELSFTPWVRNFRPWLRFAPSGGCLLPGIGQHPQEATRPPLQDDKSYPATPRPASVY